MDAAALRDAQAPLKERYKADAATARDVLRARGEVDFANVAIRVDQPHEGRLAGLHRATGGNGDFRCSGEMLLEALVGCAGVTLASVTTALAVPIERAVVRAEGDLDWRGTLGVDKTVPVGFSAIRLVLELTTNAPQDKLDKLLQLTERYCVVLQTIAQKPTLSASIVRT
ncbi:MAG TPA: OsmC family protein [Polyangiaceae bacterium]|jgi:uncharacterized OsmC-like protein